MEKYFIALDKMSIDEIEIIRLLSRYSNYETNITGYTVNQLVVNADKRLNLTTQKVRTILKKFEKEGYIQFLTSGSKGKESTLKIVLKDKLFNQQQSNNNLTTLSKKKEKNNNIYSLVIDYLNRKANTNYRSSTKNTQSFINARVSEGFTVEDFKKVIDSKSKDWIGTEWEKYLRPATLFGTKFENYLNEANKKGPTAIGPKENNNSVNPNICNPRRKYTQSCDIG